MWFPLPRGGGYICHARNELLEQNGLVLGFVVAWTLIVAPEGFLRMNCSEMSGSKVQEEKDGKPLPVPKRKLLARPCGQANVDFLI